MFNELKNKYLATLKSSETEDWFDYRVIRPLCYFLAVFFAKLNIHPNAVTIASMFIGAGSSIFFIVRQEPAVRMAELELQHGRAQGLD